MNESDPKTDDNAIFDLELRKMIEVMDRKKIKRTNLGAFDDRLRKLMDLDVSLPVILEWLTEKGRKTTLPALRRYVVRTFGKDFYLNYTRRNGWQKSPNKVALNNATHKNSSENFAGDVNKNSRDDVSILGVTEIHQILSSPPTRYPPRKR